MQASIIDFSDVVANFTKNKAFLGGGGEAISVADNSVINFSSLVVSFEKN
jgi:hypothetical protein